MSPSLPSRARARLLLPGAGWRRALGAAFALLLAGCATTPSLTDPVRHGPFYAPVNFAGEPALPAGLRRVLVLPVSLGTVADEETGLMLDAVLLAALQKQARFEVVPLDRAEARRVFGAGDFSSAAALPPGLLDALAGRTGADAVLFTDLTTYEPYRPLTLGLRAKLATVREVRLVWTFDEVLSARDPAVANSARRHFLRGDRAAQPVDLSPAALQSPSRFAAYVAETMFGTLPPR